MLQGLVKSTLYNIHIMHNLHLQPTNLQILVKVPGGLLAIIYTLHRSVSYSSNISPTKHSWLATAHCGWIHFRKTPPVKLQWCHGLDDCKRQIRKYSLNLSWLPLLNLDYGLQTRVKWRLRIKCILQTKVKWGLQIFLTQSCHSFCQWGLAVPNQIIVTSMLTGVIFMLFDSLIDNQIRIESKDLSNPSGN